MPTSQQSLRLSVDHYVFIALTGLCAGTRAELTKHDYLDAEYLRNRCQTVCPVREDRICAIDLKAYMFHIFLNKCFMWAINKCKHKDFYPLKTFDWCQRWESFEYDQMVADKTLFPEFTY